MFLCAATAPAQALSIDALVKPGDRSTTVSIDANAHDRPITVAGTRYTDGLVAEAPAHVTIALPEHHTFTTFTTHVGVEGLSMDHTGVAFQLFVDGQRQLRTRAIRKGEQPALLTVDIRGKKQIELIARQAIRHDRRVTHAAWLEPKLSRAPLPVKLDPRVYADRSVPAYRFFDTKIAGRPNKRPHYLSLPAPLEQLKADGNRYPMLVFLHGIAEGGDDHRNLFIEAIPQYLRERPAYVSQYPFIFVCPQSLWQVRFKREDVSAYVIDLIEHLRDTLPVDADRVYLTGLSDGGIGTWAIAQKRPEDMTVRLPTATIGIRGTIGPVRGHRARRRQGRHAADRRQDTAQSAGVDHRRRERQTRAARSAKHAQQHEALRRAT